MKPKIVASIIWMLIIGSIVVGFNINLYQYCEEKGISKMNGIKESIQTILENIVESQQQLHLLIGICVGVGLILFVLGFIAGKISVKRRLCFAGVREMTRQAEIEVRQIEAQNAVALQRMAYEENKAQHQRDLEIMDKEAEFRLKLVREFDGVEPAIKQCMRDWIQFANTIRKKRIEEREQYRLEQVTIFVERMKQRWNPWDKHFNINSDERERLETIVDAKLPMPTFTIQEPLRSFMDLFCRPVTGKSDTPTIEAT